MKKLEQELKAKAVPEEETPETSPTEDKPEHPEKS